MQNPWSLSHSLTEFRAPEIKSQEIWLSPSWTRAATNRESTSGTSLRSELLSEVVAAKLEGSVRMGDLLYKFT